MPSVSLKLSTDHSCPLPTCLRPFGGGFGGLGQTSGLRKQPKHSSFCPFLLLDRTEWLCGQICVSKLNYPPSTLWPPLSPFFSSQTNLRVLLGRYRTVTANAAHFIFHKQKSESSTFLKYIPDWLRAAPSLLKGVFAERRGS